MSEGPFWTGLVTIRLTWVKDDFGRDGRAIDINGIYGGEVQHLPSHAKEDGMGRCWRGWFQSDGDGQSTSWFATEQEAKDALSDMVLKVLLQ